MYGSPLSSSFFHRFPPPPVHLPRSMVSCYPSPRTTVSTRKNRQGFQRMTPVSNRLDGWMVGSSRTLSTGRSTDCDQKKLPSMFFGNDPKGINMTFFRGGGGISWWMYCWEIWGLPVFPRCPSLASTCRTPQGRLLIQQRWNLKVAKKVVKRIFRTKLTRK